MSNTEAVSPVGSSGSGAERPNLFPLPFYACAVAVLILGAFWMSVSGRSWFPLLGMCILLLAGSLLTGSASVLAARVRGRQANDAFMPFHINVVAVGACAILMGVIGVAERPLWFGMDAVPKALVKKWYPATYTANDHRQLKLACESREAGPMEIRRIDGRAYVRCGVLFPRVYTISAPLPEFERAFQETLKDPPGMPVIFNSPSES